MVSRSEVGVGMRGGCCCCVCVVCDGVGECWVVCHSGVRACACVNVGPAAARAPGPTWTWRRGPRRRLAGRTRRDARADRARVEAELFKDRLLKRVMVAVKTQAMPPLTSNHRDAASAAGTSTGMAHAHVATA